MPVPVRFRDCACPGTPHAEAGDIAYLADKLPLSGVTAFYYSVSQWPDQASIGDKVGWMAETFVRHGVMDWNVVDEQGIPVPLNIEALLADGIESLAIGAKANELYQEKTMRPLVGAARNSSPPTPTDGASTSQTTTGSPRRRKPSRSSSVTSSAGEPSPPIQ